MSRLSFCLSKILDVQWCRPILGTLWLTLVWSLCVLSAVQGATIRVPQDRSTIQQAINAAANGDTVLVAPGVYFENINFLGKAITVKSTSEPEATIIDGNQKDSVVTFASGEGPASILEGFTLQHGRSGFVNPGFGNGGGIRISSTSPTIRRNIISNNQACVGVGVSIDSGSPTIQANTITDNSQFGCSGGIGGGGISIHGNSPQILDNIISNNIVSGADGGGISVFTGTPTIRGNIISGNSVSGLTPCAQGGGIWVVNNSGALLIQNLIVANSAGCGGGIYFSIPTGQQGPLLVNNTIVDNDSPQGSGIYAVGSNTTSRLVNNIVVAKTGQTALFCGNSNPAMLRSNNIYSFSGTAYAAACANQTGLNGNISADPLFLDPSNDLYYLRAGSPSIDSGDNSAANLPSADLDGDPRILDSNEDGVAVVDMGAFEFPPSPGIIHFEPSIITAAEGSGSASVLVIRKGGATGQVNVDFTTSDGTAVAGTDYTATSGTLTFLSGEIVKSFTIPLITDATFEGTETVNLTLSNVTGGATLGARNTAVLELVEAGTLQFSSNSYSVNENGGSATITVTRTGGSTGAVSAVLTTSDGTAKAGSDYVPKTQTINFADGEISKNVPITVLDDTVYEGNETLNLQLSNPTGGVLLGTLSTATLTIADNENSVPTISLWFDGMIADRVGQGEFALGADGQADGVFTVTLNRGSGDRTVVRLDFQRSDLGGSWDTQPNDNFWVLGAASDLDTPLYNATDGTVIFPVFDGSSFKIFAADFQGSEFTDGKTFMLKASFADGTSATANVTLNLPRPTLALSFEGKIMDRVGQGEFALNPDGESDGVFTVTLNPGSGHRTVTRLDFHRSDDAGRWDTQPNDIFWVLGAASALNAPLYNTADGTVNFNLTEGSSFAIFAADFQGSEFAGGKTFILTASFADGSSATASTTIVTLPTVTIAATTANAGEGGALGAFTVTRTGSTITALTVNYTMSGSATNGADYQSLSGNVVIPVNSSSATITVVPIDDSTVEGNETVVLTLIADAAYTLGSPNSATVTIQDNDGGSGNPTIALSFDGMIRDKVGQNEFALNPDGQLDGVFTVTLNAGSGNRTVSQLQLNRAGPIGVWDTQGGDGFWSLGAANGLDTGLLNAANDSVNFAVSEGNSFKIFAADYLGQMFVPGSGFTVTANFSDGSTATASITIVTLPTVTIAATTPNATEGGALGAFTVTRTGSTTTSLTVAYTVSGSATNGADYQSLLGNIVIPVNSSSATITVVPIDDSTVEGNETVVLTLTADAGYTLGSPSTATVIMTDNDGPPAPTIALNFDGMLRDKVGQNEFALSPDGQLDGVFTVTLNVGSGNRTVSRLQLNRSGPIGVWDTQGGDGFWSLGAANGLDTGLLNAANDSVNFAVTEGNSLKIFAADYQGQMFVPGSSFTVTVNFADGSSAIGNANVP